MRNPYLSLDVAGMRRAKYRVQYKGTHRS